MKYLGSIALNVINMVVIIMCFGRKNSLTCFVFTGCLAFIKGKIKKKQLQVRILSVLFLIRTPGKGSDKTEMVNFTAMPVQVTQIRLDLNQVKNYFALCMVGQSGQPSCDHQMLKCERYLYLTKAVQYFLGVN